MQWTYEASMEVSLSIRSFMRSKSALEGFPLTVWPFDGPLDDGELSAPETVI